MNSSEKSFFNECLKDTPVADPELKTVEAILQLLDAQPYAARVRILNYVGARINVDNF